MAVERRLKYIREETNKWLCKKAALANLTLVPVFGVQDYQKSLLSSARVAQC